MTSTPAPISRPDHPAIELLPPSFTVRVGKRKLTLSWRARKPLPALLSGLLRRAWKRVLTPGLRISVAAAAVCGAWHAPLLAAAPAPGTLPTGWNVVNGNVSFAQNGNTLNINQLSPQAIAQFASFSIGANAAVNVMQPNAAAALLAKVSGSDISQIYGRLSANGTVVLYNPNGVVIGPGGTVDAGRFIATSLAISDNDFLAGKLNFVKQGSAGVVDNQGKIESATGGSVYLIGSSVSNSGIITSPQGQVILAAGQTVTLADTATPGVTVNVTGSAGNVTNLGTITAEAGRIGVAAGLITNSGVVNASSVVREGGRIFLRASKDLVTTATSSISADGTKGGNITLLANDKAFIDGDVSATGAPGQGGFIDTSGRKQLDVVKVPRVGSGGTWLIDPYDLEVVGNTSNTGNFDDSGNYAISSSSGTSQIGADLISRQLDGGVNVTLKTSGDGGDQAGNITVSADITKSNNVSSSLTLQAHNNVSIRANITSTNDSKLDLTVTTGYQDAQVPSDPPSSECMPYCESAFARIALLSGSHATTLGNGKRVVLNGGTMQVNEGNNSGTGSLLIDNGILDLGNGGQLNAGEVQVNSAGNLILHGSQISVSSLTNEGVVATNGYYNSNSVNVSGNFVNNGSFNVSGFSNNISVSGNLTNNGNFTLIGDANVTLSGSNFTNNGTVQLRGGDGGRVNVSVSADDASWINNGNLSIAYGGRINTSNGGGTSFTNNGTVTLNGGVLSFGSITNNDGASIGGNGNLSVVQDFWNYGTLAPGGDGSIGQLNISGNVTLGSSSLMKIDVDGDSSDRISFNSYLVRLGGTLQTTLLGDKPSEDVIPFQNNFGFTGWLSGYFRYVKGDVLTDGNGQRSMLKSFYDRDEGGGIVLAMAGSQVFYADGSVVGTTLSKRWEDRTSWTDANGANISTYLPTEIDSVVLRNGINLRHNSGDDTVASLSIGSDSSLTMRGGSLTASGGNSLNGSLNVSNGSVVLNGVTTGNANVTIGTPPNDGDSELIGTGNLTIASAAQSGMKVQLNNGSLNFGGDLRLANLSVADGTVTGNTGSRLVVSESFNQSGGNLTLADAALSQDSGSLAVGNITASNLVLEARNGNISQNTGTAMRVKSQLIASAGSGITFNNSGNQIAGFAANNSGTGNITFRNTLNTSDASVVSINGVTTTRGNISIDNTGGAASSAIGSKAAFLGSLPVSANGTAVSADSKLALLGINSNGEVKTSNGSVSMVTHSPLTIGSGGVSATGTITLTAGASSGSNDTLIINGVLVSTGGNIVLSAGDSMTINANISTSPPGVALLSVDSGTVIGYAQGVTITDVNGTRTPATSSSNGSSGSAGGSGSSGSSSSGTSQSAQVVQQQQNQQSQNLQATLKNAQLSDTNPYNTGNVVQQSTPNGQTVGGTTDNFGDEGGERKQTKKPLPMCT